MLGLSALTQTQGLELTQKIASFFQGFFKVFKNLFFKDSCQNVILQVAIEINIYMHLPN